MERLGDFAVTVLLLRFCCRSINIKRLGDFAVFISFRVNTDSAVLIFLLTGDSCLRSCSRASYLILLTMMINPAVLLSSLS